MLSCDAVHIFLTIFTRCRHDRNIAVYVFMVEAQINACAKVITGTHVYLSMAILSN